MIEALRVASHSGDWQSAARETYGRHLPAENESRFLLPEETKVQGSSYRGCIVDDVAAVADESDGGLEEIRCLGRKRRKSWLWRRRGGRRLPLSRTRERGRG